jgi:hypothetical protein
MHCHLKYLFDYNNYNITNTPHYLCLRIFYNDHTLHLLSFIREDYILLHTIDGMNRSLCFLTDFIAFISSFIIVYRDCQDPHSMYYIYFIYHNIKRDKKD